ncbi:MAG: DUF5069 domain-containing protein [Verrucomicrobiota bacterium]
MKTNLAALELLAKNLRKQEPRHASEELAGYPMAARCLDKCRASLLGWQGDFTYGCPMDREFLTEAGLDLNEFRDFVATGASDNEVSQWIEAHSSARH